MTAQDLEPTVTSEHDLVAHALAHLGHILPAQAPIQDFVHHNTLHGFQHLPFEQALAEAEKLSGICAYLPEEKNREFYRQIRINDDDLLAAIAQKPDLKHEEVVFDLGDAIITRKDVYRISLIYGLDGIDLSQLNWQIEELAALDTVQTDVPEDIQKKYLEQDQNDTDCRNPVRRLWESLCHQLEQKPAAFHPEAMLDLTLEQTERWLDATCDTTFIHQQTQELAKTAMQAFFNELGESLTLRSLIRALSGKDVLDNIRPQLITLCASALDDGVAPWHLPGCSQFGLYGSWRTIAQHDAYPFLHELPDWPQIMSNLPEDAIDNIIRQLKYLELPQTHWQGYLYLLALELPGWAGMVNWRQTHPNYFTANKVVPKLADYLAIRLTLDHLWLNQVSRDIWKCEAKLSTLQSYFGKNLSEFVVRYNLYHGKLPEYLNHQAELLVIRADSERQCRSEWQHLADLIYTWQASPMADKYSGNNLTDTTWRLFRLCQHLGLKAEQVNQLGKNNLLKLANIVDGFDWKQRRQIWLVAYERHYREELFNALSANQGRGRWAKRERTPVSQIVFCMDDREESFRRHLEELEPAIETLGAAGFFGLAMNYKGLDDERFTPLCPIVVTPAHEVTEQPHPASVNKLQRHQQGRKLHDRFNNLLHHGLRTNLFISLLLTLVTAPILLLGLLAKSFIPKPQYGWLTSITNTLSGAIKTQLLYTSTDNHTMATPNQPKLGFTETEQVDRIAGFLRNTGLTYGFAELIVLMGHGSISQNNPHLAAYDCGACSGRHGGPNARLFAAMANRPEVRKGLAERGILIPDETWFIGAEHNTCNEEITWYDTDGLPLGRRQGFEKLKQQLGQAQQLSAHERCRRLASAPRNPGLKEALNHIMERATDFSQARPELGHATNAAAIVGRRCISQGTFLDRRVFLISYDPTQDPDGKIVEGILLNVGPVGAGINLEYYFSTVNNDRLGCGTKVPHNIVGLFGVMEGTASDLRTGLPNQMVEIHEAMRLQLVVEAKTSILEQIYARQESLRELIAGGWILLSAIDPANGEIFVFEHGRGFVQWQTGSKPFPVYENSPACYCNHTTPVAPALIKQPPLVLA